ncbi:MAG TPA: hypothetical protein VFW21_02620 [Mycobacterium sp.]|jgi:hypothetical protein|nr:hypothetical protein [Mycobacterium sp.]
MHYIETLLHVLIVGLVLGAGLPAVFAIGLRAYSAGAGGVEADGTAHAPNPALKAVGLAVFLFVSAVIVLAVLWIARATIIHHTGVDLFPMLKK